MNHRLLFLAAAAALLLPAEAPAQLMSGFRYEQSVVGPGGGMHVGQRSGGAIAGPFGASSWESRSGTFVAPSGATVQYAERSGAVFGPLGGMRGASTSYVHAESADRGFTYSRYSSRSVATGPVGGMAVGPFGGVAVGPVGGVTVSRTAAVAGPFGPVGYSRAGGMIWP